jgi:hypothetical protein
MWSSRWNENWQGKPNYSEKPFPVPLCPPQIPHDLTWARIRAVAVGSRRLTAWAMALPVFRKSWCIYVKLEGKLDFVLKFGEKYLVKKSIGNTRHIWRVYLLRYNAMKFVESQPSFRRNMSLWLLIASRWFLAWLEDGTHMFLWNVGWISTEYTALYPRR